MKTKRCGTCQKKKPLTYFNKKAQAPDGLQSRCKSCNKNSCQFHYLTNKDRYRENVRQRKVRLRNQVSQIKIEKGCKHCHYNLHPAALEFHHSDENKELNISQMISNGIGMLRILEEIKKCIILCANCYRIEHAAPWTIG